MPRRPVPTRSQRSQRTSFTLVVFIESGREQMAKFALEEHPNVAAWARNHKPRVRDSIHGGSVVHDYILEFLVRLQWEGREVGTLVPEVKGGYNEFNDIAETAARRWVNAVIEDGPYRRWECAICARSHLCQGSRVRSGTKVRTPSL